MKKLTTKKNIGYTLAVMIAIFGLAGGVVLANPSFFPKGVSSTTATSTPIFVAVTATTTNVAYDTFNSQAGGVSANTSATNSISLLLQMIGSSSPASIMKWRYEFADDTAGFNCVDTPLACDWYSESVNTIAGTASTTQEVATFRDYSWSFASSTIGGILGGQATSSDRALKLVSVPTPTRYVRVVIYKAIGSANFAYWAKLLPIKERSE